MTFENAQAVHFVGIGGSGISALALLALSQGKKVTGSDVSESVFSNQCKVRGASVMMGHDAKHLPENVELVIYSEAIDKTTNTEYLAAVKQGLPVLSYFEALGALSRLKKTVIVVGSHGKTTTTAMLGQAVIGAGVDATVIVGSRVPAFDHQNIYIGGNEWLVVEGCEYRRSFLNLKPYGVVLLNCEYEHPDYYHDEADYVWAFEELVAQLPDDGFLVFNGADANACHVAEGFGGQKIKIDANVVERLNFAMQIPGEFNEWNAAHAYHAAMLMGIEKYVARVALEHFTGTARRMELKGEVNGVLIIDDYGHHPTEVKATLGALKQKYPNRRLICVFQPHQFSRTFEMLTSFAGAFGDADVVIIPNIYEARDSATDKSRVSAQRLVEVIGGRHSNVTWGETLENTETLLHNTIKEGDLVVTMGAGDVGQIADKLLV